MNISWRVTAVTDKGVGLFINCLPRKVWSLLFQEKAHYQFHLNFNFNFSKCCIYFSRFLLLMHISPVAFTDWWLFPQLQLHIHCTTYLKLTLQITCEMIPLFRWYSKPVTDVVKRSCRLNLSRKSLKLDVSDKLWEVFTNFFVPLG